MGEVYIPLLTYAHANGAAGGEVIPGLAKELPKISNGGKTYTLFLRPGLKYSDGTPVKASDFTYAVERCILLSSGGSPFYSGIVGAEKFAETKKGGIPGIKTDDQSGEIVINLTKPRGTFTNELGLMFVAPVPPDTPISNQSTHPIPATGPYMITKSNPSKGWSYERNPYWEKANSKAMPDLPSGHMDKINVTIIGNASTQVNDVEQGKFDWMQTQIPPDRYPEVKSKYEGSQFRVENDDQHLLLLDEHDEAAVRRPQGPPGGQLRARPGGDGTDLRRPARPGPSRSCRPGCPATKKSSSTRRTWPKRRN